MKRFLLLLLLTTLTVACSTSSTRKTSYIKELERRIKKLENKFGNKKERHPSNYHTHSDLERKIRNCKSEIDDKADESHSHSNYADDSHSHDYADSYHSH